MGKMKRCSSTTKIYTGKNGYTSTFTKTKNGSGKTKWIRTGGSPKRTKKI